MIYIKKITPEITRQLTEIQGITSGDNSEAGKITPEITRRRERKAETNASGLGQSYLY